ncbi:MAG: hypothetical protein AAF608_04650 [Pseudomonadota bacterium]
MFYIGRQFVYASMVLETTIQGDLSFAAPRHFTALHAAEALTKGIARLSGIDFGKKHSETWLAYLAVKEMHKDFPDCFGVFTEYLKSDAYTDIRYYDWRQISGTPIDSFVGEAVIVSRWAERKFELSPVSSSIHIEFQDFLLERTDLKAVYPSLWDFEL